jgi:hypothetical protein
MFGFARGAAEEAEKETGVKLKSSSPIPKKILASFQQALKEQVVYISICSLNEIVTVCLQTTHELAHAGRMANLAAIH